jgi:hypothetical protein
MRTHISFQRWTARLLAVMALPAVYACGDDSPSVSEFPCESPTPLLPGSQTGFELCASGFIHRPTTAQCPSTLPRAEEICSGDGLACNSDADCADVANGFCGYGNGFEGGCVCNAGCLTDADCGAGSICMCGDPVGSCVAADCTTDEDCDGGLCASTIVGDPGCGSLQFRCQTGQDECGGNADCPEGKSCVIPEGGGPRVCRSAECNIGRPFLVAGVTRAAETTGRADWRALDLAPSLEGLDETTRRELGGHWAHAGAMEHASIAAFARFALQLLSLGAPASLLEATQAAMADETEHARVCYGLASKYLGRAVGPAPLDVGGALESMDAASIVADAIREGCIGETVASMEAAEAAACAEDPAIRAALLRIAEDEARHAELAWRFVRWAVSRDASLRAEAARVFAEEAAAARGASRPEAEDLAWLACGRVTPAVHRRLHEQAMSRVVTSCARALLAAPPLEATASAA